MWKTSLHSACTAQNSQDLKKSAFSHDSKANEACKMPKELSTNISALPSTSSQGLSMSVKSQLLIHCSLVNRLGFNMKSHVILWIFCVQGSSHFVDTKN